MKISKAITQNKSFWENEIFVNETRRDNHAREAVKYDAAVKEAKEQLDLWTKAEEILPSLNQDQVEKIKVTDINSVEKINVANSTIDVEKGKVIDKDASK